MFKYKKVVLFICLLVTIFSCSAIAEGVAHYLPGDYEVSAEGMHTLTLKVSFSDTAITGIEVVKSNETEGLGTRALDNLIPEIIEKQTTEIDTWSGATVTSYAIIDAVNLALEQAALPVIKYKPGDYEVSAEGMHTLTLKVSFSDTAITGIEVVKSNETEGLGTRALDNLIPEIIEKQTTQIDTWSGATVTSYAIIDAVNLALEQAALPVNKYNPGDYEVSAEGMHTLTLKVSFNDTAITGIEVVKSNETEGLGTRALDNLIPEIIEKQTTEVDVWSGATVTSYAIIDAVNLAIEQATAR